MINRKQMIRIRIILDISTLDAKGRHCHQLRRSTDGFPVSVSRNRRHCWCCYWSGNYCAGIIFFVGQRSVKLSISLSSPKRVTTFIFFLFFGGWPLQLIALSNVTTAGFSPELDPGSSGCSSTFQLDATLDSRMLFSHIRSSVISVSSESRPHPATNLKRCNLN